MNRILGKVLIILLCALALCSVNLFCTYKVSNTLIYYISCIGVIGISCYYYFKDEKYRNWIYWAPTIYIIWTIFEIIRGISVADSYWVTNQLIHGTFDALPQVVIFLFSSPLLFIRVFQPLNRFIILSTLILAGWCLPFRAFAFMVVPFFFLYSCFISKIPSRWFWITLGIIIIIGVQIDNRSGVIKVLLSLCIFCLFILPKKIQSLAINVSHWFFYTIAIVLLWLGLSGQYNIFDSHYFDEKDDRVVFTNNIDEKQEKSTLSIDTRSFIYLETITTAIDYDCILIGRSPAHGYISPWFTVSGPIEPGRDPTERFASEVGMLNTFIWLGIIGVILVAWIFIQGTSLALYNSRNIYVKCIAVWCAFQWLYSWVENCNEFHLVDLMIYCNLAICYSPTFRKMDDQQFTSFFISIFDNNNNGLLYKRYCLLRVYLESKIRTLSHRTTT